MSRKGKTILVRDSSTQTRIKKVSVEYPCDNRDEDLNVVINNEDFFGNLSISNDVSSPFERILNFFTSRVNQSALRILGFVNLVLNF